MVHRGINVDMMLLKWLLVPLALYGALVALMYVAQRTLLYHPDRTRMAPEAAGLPTAQEVELTTADGETVIVWHVPPRDGRPVVLYFHGNAGSLRHRAGRFQALTADGTGLVALSYRGYGGSTGSPTETGLLADAAAAHAFAAQRYTDGRLVLWGESLGTGVAVATAAQYPVARVLLESPFTSIADVGAAAYPFLPVRPLTKDAFRSDLRIAKVSAPVLVLHGELDRIVPISHGEKLYGLIRSQKEFVRIPRAGHNDHDDFDAIALVKAFIDGSSPPVRR